MITVSLEHVSKSYLITKGKYGLLADAIASLFTGGKGSKNKINALKNVSFGVKSGETLGIIGKNGAGKTTILKLISKITYPNSGKISAKGRIGAFIELGAGLHPELSGRENIFLYGSILGMKKREIEERFSQIVNFARIGKFLDLPIKKFSSGMYSRLGFSVVAFCDPDILLVDEVLAVGDVNFQKRCLMKMNEFKQAGKTIIFVSHDMNAIRSICDRVLCLEKGRVKKIGATAGIVDFYLKKAKSDFNLGD